MKSFTLLLFPELIFFGAIATMAAPGSFSDVPGTWITQEVEQMEQIVVSGVAVKKDLAQFVLMGLPNRPGVAASIFAHVAEHKVAVDDIIQTADQSG